MLRERIQTYRQAMKFEMVQIDNPIFIHFDPEVPVRANRAGTMGSPTNAFFILFLCNSYCYKARICIPRKERQYRLQEHNLWWLQQHILRENGGQIRGMK